MFSSTVLQRTVRVCVAGGVISELEQNDQRRAILIPLEHVTRGMHGHVLLARNYVPPIRTANHVSASVFQQGSLVGSVPKVSLTTLDEKSLHFENETENLTGAGFEPATTGTYTVPLKIFIY